VGVYEGREGKFVENRGKEKAKRGFDFDLFCFVLFCIGVIEFK